MQAVSILATPVIMSAADLLFSTFKEDKYTKESKRHNLRMEEIERQSVEWQQKFAEEENAFAKRRLTKEDAKNNAQEDRKILNQLLIEKDVLKGQKQAELSKHKRKNPYYLTADLITSSGLLLLAYVTYRIFNKRSCNLTTNSNSDKSLEPLAVQ